MQIICDTLSNQAIKEGDCVYWAIGFKSQMVVTTEGKMSKPVVTALK